MGKRKTKRWVLVLVIILIPIAAIPLTVALMIVLRTAFDDPNPARWEKARSEMGEIQKALNMHFFDHRDYPSTLDGVAPAFGG